MPPELDKNKWSRDDSGLGAHKDTKTWSDCSWGKKRRWGYAGVKSRLPRARRQGCVMGYPPGRGGGLAGLPTAKVRRGNGAGVHNSRLDVVIVCVPWQGKTFAVRL